MAMRTTSSMPPWLPTTIVSTEPAAVVGMGAPAQTQSGYYLPANLLLRVLSSQAHRSLRSPCNCRSVSAAMHVRACMRVWLGRYVHSCERTQVCMLCVTACLCVRVRPCAEHARVSTRAYVRDVVLSACVRAGVTWCYLRACGRACRYT